MALTLDDAEQRILGVLMEKCLSQPGSYPLTLNMIVLGANQKQNRDPVVEFPERELARALHSLQTRNLVGQARSAIGARANRFEHRVVEQLGWDRREQAVMAELLLRGRPDRGRTTHACVPHDPVQRSRLGHGHAWRLGWRGYRLR